MQKMILVSACMFCFGLGCVAATISDQPAHASVVRGVWEYSCQEHSGISDVESYAEEMGVNGWEMVNFTGSSGDMFSCFKRQG